MKFPFFLSATLLSASLALQAAPDAPTAVRTIQADVTQTTGPLNTMFRECVGAGRANEGLRADWQRQLAQVRKECGFKYLRMHGLLTDDMGVYREDKAGKAIYNWQYIDELYDYLLSIDVKPFVELGFMPNALASGDKSIFWWRGNVTQPKDHQKWADFMTALVTHWTERYGHDEVRTWYFEVWNEPNLDGFFKGTQADYFKLYQTTAAAIKKVSPDYRVGGPATAGAAWIPETLAFCAEQHVPIDFVTTHTYAVDQGFLDENGDHGTVFSKSPDSISGDVKNSRKQIEASAFPGLELHYTEWSASYTPSDPIHDSYHSAAFIIDRLRKSGNAAQSMSYWVFTDIFEEAGPRATPFHGGFGLLNYQGIAKPAYFAFQFLNKLSGQEVRSSDASSWITADAKGRVTALVWDFTNTHPGEKPNNQVYYTQDLPPAAKGKAALQLAGLKPGSYTLEIYKVGYRVNDAYAVYKDLGAPAQLTRAEVAKLKSASSGAPELKSTVTVGADGAFHYDWALRENDVVLVQLSPN